MVSSLQAFLSLLALLLAGPLATAASNPSPPAIPGQNAPAMTAIQLLDAFAKGQSQWKSFIARYEFSRQEDASTVSGSSSWFVAGETRFDGQRVSVRNRLWGRITPDTVRTKEAPCYKSRMFDGRWRWQYEQPFWRAEDAPRGQPGTLIIRSVSSPPREPIELLDFCDSTLTHGLGVLLHDGGKRFDARMRPAASLRVRDRLEPAGWEPSPCYVLEANTAHGHYTVWLDDIRNGVQVFYPNQGNKRPGTWHNGRVVDEAGQVILGIGITSERRNQP